jgi:hypothetical protein
MDVNGVYEPTSEVSSGVTVYRKVGDADRWLEYHAGAGQWQVKCTARKGEDVSAAYCIVPAKCLPEECPVGQWQVQDGATWVSQASVTVSIVSQAELEAHKAAIAAEAARQVVGTTSVRLAGATGVSAMDVNGVYEPTSEVSSSGVTVYRKVGEADRWLEYHAGSRSWQVKDTSDKGKDVPAAYCAVPAKCLPEACPVGQWQVTDDGSDKPVPQASVTVSIVSQGELEAHKAAMAAEAARLCNGTTSVRLAGATGRCAMDVNGVYEPTSEVSSGGVTVYRKVGDADRWLEYHAGAGQWQVKCTAWKGEDVSAAYCIVPAKCLPEECPVGQWQVLNVDEDEDEGGDDSGDYATQASVTVSIVSQ